MRWAVRWTMATSCPAGLCRAMMGVGEGVTFPSIQNLVRRWVPEGSRSRALSFIYSGHQLGTIASYLLAPILIHEYGWPAVFWIFGSLGFVWLLGWQPLVKNDPSELLPAAAAAAAAGGAGPSGPPAAAPAAAPTPAAPAPSAAAAGEALRLQDIPWGSFLRNPAFLATVAAQVANSVGSCLCFSWLPTYYNQGKPGGWPRGSAGVSSHAE
jgi:ACS family sodium-dependent inorganic phosphate cotransporter